jgi:hypothetical protein
VLVASRVGAVRQRDAIRETYAQQRNSSQSSEEFLTFFVLGRESLNHSPRRSMSDRNIASEHRKHDDILQFDFLDTYDNLTIKTKLALRWANSLCPDSRYILKTDDDTYLNMPVIMKSLKTLKLSSIAGYCFTIKPSRNNTSKSHASYAMYPYTYTPVFCSGQLYVIAREILGLLVATSDNVKFYPSEDTYWTGLVRSVAGLSYQQMPGCGYTFKQFPKLSDSARQLVAGYHNVRKPKDMHTLWHYYSNGTLN